MNTVIGNKRTVMKVYCGACGGTGLFRDFNDTKGIATICLRCQGTGYQEITIEPFEKRKRKTGIVSVTRSVYVHTGTAPDPKGHYITYDEFCSGKMPKQTIKEKSNK